MTNLISIAMVLIMLMPSLGTIIPVNSEKSDVQEEPWWVDTTVDRNKNGIGDMIEKHIDKKKHFLGSVYDLFSPVINFSYNPVGEWNNYFIRIDQENNLGSVKLNGIIINEFPLKGPEWNSALSKSKFNNSNEYPYLGDKRWYDFGKFSKGFICFQDHPGKAYFKNIKIRELR